MKAIYRGVVCHVTDETKDGVILDGELAVSFSDLGLVIDPTDQQIEAAHRGDTIPMEPEERAFLEDLARTVGGYTDSEIEAAATRHEDMRAAAIQRRH